MLEVSTVLAVIALVIFIFFWAGVLMIFGFSTRLPFLAKSRPTPRKAKLPEMYRNMRNCTINDVWIDGSGVPHKLSLLRRIVLWLKFHNPLSRVRRMIRRSGIGAREFRRGPVGAQTKYDQCGRDMSGLRQNFWGSQAADPTISVAMMPGDTYHNSVLNHLRHLNQSMTAWLNDTASGGNATLVVAAVNSLHPERADYQCDGVDDQITINSAISALPAGGGKVVFSEGTYNISATITVRDNIELSGQGFTTIFKSTNTVNINIFTLTTGQDNITFRSLAIDGDYVNNLVAGRGITGLDNDYVRLYNVEIKNCRYQGLYLEGTVSIQSPEVVDCYIHHNRRQGIRSLFPIAAKVKGNEVAYNGNDGGATNQGIYADSPTRSIFTDNICYGNDGHGIATTGESYNVTNNTCWANGSMGIDMASADNVICSGNYCYANGLYGIYVHDSHYSIFEGNRLRNNGNGTAGITIHGTAARQSYGNMVAGNICSSIVGQQEYGVEFTGGVDCHDNKAIDNISLDHDTAAFRDTGTNNHWRITSTDCKGTTSTTAGIQEAINALPATGGEVFIPAGTHTTSTTITITKSRVVLRGAGESTLIILANAVNNNIITIGDGGGTTVEYVTIKSLMLNGNAAGQGAGAYNGIYMNMKVRYSHFKDLYIYNCKQDGISTNSTILADANFHNIIEGCLMRSQGRHDIYIGLICNDHIIVNNNLGGSGADGIHMNQASLCRICDNIIINQAAIGINMEDGAFSSNSICNNSVEFGTEGIHLGLNGFNLTVNGNNLKYQTVHGIWARITGSSIVGNSINAGTANADGIWLNTCNSLTVTGNSIADMPQEGIVLNTCTYCNIIGNTISGVSAKTNNTYMGILIQNASKFNLIDSNFIYGYGVNQPAYGIAEGNVINEEDNIIQNNRVYGYRTDRIYTCGPGVGPRPVQSIQCYLAYATNNIDGAQFNHAAAAVATQPDVARNLTYEKVGATANGGQVVVVGTDLFGNAVTETTVFAGGAAITVGTKIFASITTATITALTAGDTIQVGIGNKLGLDHKIFTGAVIKVYRSDTGNSVAANWAADVTYHGVDVTGGGAVANGDVFLITSLDCLA